jgi:hypothetical protein
MSGGMERATLIPLAQGTTGGQGGHKSGLLAAVSGQIVELGCVCRPRSKKVSPAVTQVHPVVVHA